MTKHLSVVYDTTNWTKDRVRAVITDESARVTSWGHAIYERDKFKEARDFLRADQNRGADTGKTKFILVSGKKRSGKDFFSNLLKKEFNKLGFSVQVIAFADPIKDIISRTLGISRETLDYYKNDQTPIYIGEVLVSNARSILQSFGTDAMKCHFGDNVWVDLLMARAKQSNADYVIVPDFRFPEEYLTGAITIRVQNNDLPNDDSHRSENSLDDFNFNYVLDNTGYCLGRPDAHGVVKKILSINTGWREHL